MSIKRYTDADFFRVAELLMKQEWTFAKTMAENPHWYTVRQRWERDEDFVFTVEYMRANGYDGWFGGREYRYWDFNGRTYWTMGDAINLPDGKPHTRIINRKPRTQQVEYFSDYDHIADQYDTMFSTPEYQAENEQVFGMAPKINRGDRVLEIGCGSGPYFSSAGIDQMNYVGVDPSAGMLERFRAAHLDKSLNLVCDKFENFYAGKFDLIVSFFGSMSYVRPDALTRIPKMLRPGGRLFLMFYADEYDPVTHQQLKINPHIYRGAYGHQNFCSAQKRFSNYVILA